jgi:Ca-activated chloride channel homolog
MPRTTVNYDNFKECGLFASSNSQLIFPLKHTSVNAKIALNVSRVEVRQSFENPFTETLEAIYVFPLPDEAAVDEMEIQIGDRIIQGSIKKREEAQQIYDQAKEQGRTAGLLEQERDNIFTQSLANIKPGEQIDVTIRYTESLKFNGGNYEFVFPMVVGPRYIPGTSINNIGDTDIIPDASRITPPVVPEGMRSKHDIHVTAEIQAGLPVVQINSPSHQLQIEYGEEIQVTLAGENTIPNQDFILRYEVAGKQVQSTVLTQADHRGGHFALYLIPALEYQADEIVPKDIVFLVDASGSQSGEPLQQCQKLMRRFINGLNRADTFSILDFSTKVRKLSQTPLANTPENCAKAINYIDRLQASGGTEMLTGIRAAIKLPVSAGRLRTIVLLSDGYIGNENEILAEVQQELASGNRLYSFGAGSSVNRFLLNRIAEIGRGISYIIRQDEPIDKTVENFFQQLNNPVLTNIDVTWEGDGEAPIIYPYSPPDLFKGQPLVIFGRKLDKVAGKLTVRGTTIAKEYQKSFELSFAEEGNSGIAQLWGRARIKALTNQMLSYESKAGVEEVIDTALTYKLLSQYTAFVAVSEEVRVNPDGESITVEVPLEMPQGVSYEGIFGEVEERARGITICSPAVGSMYFLASPAPQSDDKPDFLQKRRNPASPIATNGEDDTQQSNLKILSATGLDTNAINALTLHLEKCDIPSGCIAEMVFELLVNKGRVQRVTFDEDASTLNAIKPILVIRRSLSSWQPPQNITGKVRIILRIYS